MKIDLRLMLSYFFAVVMTGYVVFKILAINFVFSHDNREEMLMKTAKLLVHFIQQDMHRPGAVNGQSLQKIINFNRRSILTCITGLYKNSHGYHIRLTDASGMVFFDSSAKKQKKLYSGWNEIWHVVRHQYTDHDDSPSFYNSLSWTAVSVIAESKVMGIVSVGQISTDMMPLMKEKKYQFAFAGTILLSTGLLIGLFFIWWINHSVKLMARYTENGTQGQPLSLPVLGEFTGLAQELESMRLKLEKKAYIEQYVHTLTHELKSPLAAIRGAAELLRESPPREVAERFLRNIDQQSMRIQKLIETMLMQARVESRADLECFPMDIGCVLRQAVVDKEPQAVNCDIILQLNGCDNAGIVGDAFLLGQALVNLLDNALDFTLPGGRVDISGVRHADCYQICIADNGIGIPDYALDKIFERFYSLPRPCRPKSTGLGLNFVREVISLHHGSVTVKNRTERGVEVQLILPFPR